MTESNTPRRIVVQSDIPVDLHRKIRREQGLRLAAGDQVSISQLVQEALELVYEPAPAQRDQDA